MYCSTHSCNVFPRTHTQIAWGEKNKATTKKTQPSISSEDVSEPVSEVNLLLKKKSHQILYTSVIYTSTYNVYSPVTTCRPAVSCRRAASLGRVSTRMGVCAYTRAHTRTSACHQSGTPPGSLLVSTMLTRPLAERGRAEAPSPLPPPRGAPRAQPTWCPIYPPSRWGRASRWG